MKMLTERDWRKAEFQETRVSQTRYNSKQRA
jgi:hypothetical protein